MEEKKYKEHLHGGKADGKKPSDFNEDDIEIGAAVQREHTTDTDTKEEISMDHAQENPDYYDELIMSGIADEPEAINKYNQLKTDRDKKKAINKIQTHLNKEKQKLESHILSFKEFILL